MDDVGNCPAEYLQSCFTLLSPVRNLLGKPTSLMDRMDDAKFVEEFLTMESWINDNVACRARSFAISLSTCTSRTFWSDQMQVGRKVVDLRQITCPVLNLLATQDTLVPPAQSTPFTRLVGSDDTKTIELAAGHIGLAMGSAAQRELWPQAVSWLAERS